MVPIPTENLVACSREVRRAGAKQPHLSTRKAPSGRPARTLLHALAFGSIAAVLVDTFLLHLPNVLATLFVLHPFRAASLLACGTDRSSVSNRFLLDGDCWIDICGQLPVLIAPVVCSSSGLRSPSPGSLHG